MSDRSTAYHLLKTLSELYPRWAQSLNKNKEQKIRICGGYRNSLDDSMTIEHIDAMADWLRSEANKEYRGWPPQPLEVRTIIAMVQKQVEPQVIKHEAIVVDAPSEYCVAQFVHKDVREIPTEAAHLIPYVIQYQETLRTNRNFVNRAMRLCYCFYNYADRLRMKYSHISKREILDRFFSNENQTALMMELGNLKDVPILLNFLRETKISPEIFEEHEKLSAPS